MPPATNAAVAINEVGGATSIVGGESDQLRMAKTETTGRQRMQYTHSQLAMDGRLALVNGLSLALSVSGSGGTGGGTIPGPNSVHFVSGLQS